LVTFSSKTVPYIVGGGKQVKGRIKGRELIIIEKTMNLAKQTLICRINKDLEIWADDKQYILRRNRDLSRDWYYADLESLIQDIFEMKLKEFAFHDDDKNLRNLGKAIKEATDFIHEVIRPMMNGYQNKN